VFVHIYNKQKKKMKRRRRRKKGKELHIHGESIPNARYNITSEKIVLFIVTSVRTSNLIFLLCLKYCAL
jgi:hypothetical protein